MFKFKKEDIGLYFALGLTGAGVGLLVGAFIASRRDKKIVINELDLVLEDEDFVVEEKVEVKKKKDRPIKTRNGNDITTQEFKEFCAQWSPTPIQIEMYRSQVITMEELRGMVVAKHEAELKEPYSYNTYYSPEDDEKPDLEDLVDLVDEDIDLIEERWAIYDDILEGYEANPAYEFFYDPEDETFMYLSGRGNPVNIQDINKFISDAVWDKLEPLLLRNTNPIYIEDVLEDKIYRFDLVPSDEEDSSAVYKDNVR